MSELANAKLHVKQLERKVRLLRSYADFLESKIAEASLHTILMPRKCNFVCSCWRDCSKCVLGPMFVKIQQEKWLAEFGDILAGVRFRR